MTAPVRWPLHPAPKPGEALSSWLRRVGAGYQMSVAELIEHGLGRDPETPHDLDLDPPLSLLDVLSACSGIDRHRLQQMSLAGWMPATVDSLEASPSAFEGYVRRYSVLLDQGKRSKHAEGSGRPWITRSPVTRACPCCVEDPTVQCLLLMGRFPLQLSCPHHGYMLEACIGFPGDFMAWTAEETTPRVASATVLAMDRRTEQGLATGQVDLPGRTVNTAEWFRLLRTLLDEVAAPVSCWGPRAADLRRIWAGCGHPVRAGQVFWRPFEHYPWVVQSHMLEAAAEAIRLLETGTVSGRGADAGCFVSAPAVGDSRTSFDGEDHVDRWALLWGAMEDAIVAARARPAEAQALFDLLVYGCRTSESIEELLVSFRELGIPPPPVIQPAHTAVRVT